MPILERNTSKRAISGRKLDLVAFLTWFCFYLVSKSPIFTLFNFKNVIKSTEFDEGCWKTTKTTHKNCFYLLFTANVFNNITDPFTLYGSERRLIIISSCLTNYFFLEIPQQRLLSEVQKYSFWSFNFVWVWFTTAKTSSWSCAICIQPSRISLFWTSDNSVTMLFKVAMS